MRLICLLLFWGSLSPLIAQTAEQDLHHLLEPLINAKELYYDNIYYYYEEGEKTPSDTLTGIFHRSGAMEYIKMGDMEMLETGRLTIMADHEDHVVAVRKSARAIALDKMFDTKALISLAETRQMQVQYANRSDHAILITDPEKPGEKMLVRYDREHMIIRELEITTADPLADPFEQKTGMVTILVLYKNVATTPVAFGHTVNQYVQKKGSSYTATGKCKGYILI